MKILLLPCILCLLCLSCINNDDSLDIQKLSTLSIENGQTLYTNADVTVRMTFLPGYRIAKNSVSFYTNGGHFSGSSVMGSLDSIEVPIVNSQATIRMSLSEKAGNYFLRSRFRIGGQTFLDEKSISIKATEDTVNIGRHVTLKIEGPDSLFKKQIRYLTLQVDNTPGISLSNIKFFTTGGNFSENGLEQVNVDSIPGILIDRSAKVQMVLRDSTGEYLFRVRFKHNNAVYYKEMYRRVY